MKGESLYCILEEYSLYKDSLVTSSPSPCRAVICCSSDHGRASVNKNFAAPKSFLCFCLSKHFYLLQDTDSIQSHPVVNALTVEGEVSFFNPQQIPCELPKFLLPHLLCKYPFLHFPCPLLVYSRFMESRGREGG